MQRIGEVAGPDGRVRAQAQDVVLVDPGVIRSLGGTVSASERGSRKRVERPAFGTEVAFRSARPVEASLALTTVEAGDVTAGQRHPGHAVAVDVEPTHPESGRRDLVDLGERGLRGI